MRRFILAAALGGLALPAAADDSARLDDVCELYVRHSEVIAAFAQDMLVIVAPTGDEALITATADAMQRAREDTADLELLIGLLCTRAVGATNAVAD